MFRIEETLICAKFGKDLFNISKVIGHKKWPSFFWLTVYIFIRQGGTGSYYKHK